jgi:hypothetical protein
VVRIAGPFSRIAGSLPAVIGATWLAFLCPATAQSGCIITGGTNYGSITQNCNFAPPPLSFMMDRFETTKVQDKFEHRTLVRANAPVTLALIACGDAVVDVNAFPWPAGMMVGPGPAEKSGNCTRKIFPNLTPGQWVFSVQTIGENDKFTLQPITQ